MSNRRGQALIETAITLPVMLILLLGYLATLVAIEGQVELDTATSLAAASCAAAQVNGRQCYQWANETYQDTLQHYTYLRPGPLRDCDTQPQVTCEGSVTLVYQNTPMGFVIPGNITLTSTASAAGSPYRSR
jgi:Flp pilus assembly protein TadG